MSDSHGHGAVENPFTPAQWDQLRAADVSAARAVVYLMVGIFSMGVVLYSIVAWVVAQH